MQLVMSVARIQGKGPCEAIYNGMVDERMRRQAAQHRMELEGVEELRRLAEADRNRLRARRLAQLRQTRRPSAPDRAKRRIADAWCILWAWALELGLVEDDREEGGQ